MKLGFFVVVLGCALCACSSQPVKDESAKAPVSAPAAPQPAAHAPKLVTPPVATNPLDEPQNILYKRSVYFDFDKYDIKPEYQPLIQAHAKYLSVNPGARVAIQGNCDELGSTEYNLALGQRRADAVKNAMKLLGAKEAQMESVSFGKEKPKAVGHDEASRAENRRDDIVYNVKR